MSTPRFDITRLSCLEQARALFNAITEITTGRKKVQVRYGEQWIEYHRTSAGDLDLLRQMYQSIWSGCAEAQQALPDLRPGARARRGPGMITRIHG